MDSVRKERDDWSRVHDGVIPIGLSCTCHGLYISSQGSGNIDSRPYHVKYDMCWWSHVGGFQKAEKRTDDEVKLVPLKKR